MNRYLLLSLVLATLLLSPVARVGAQTFSSTGREFWLGFMENRDVNEGSTFALVIISDVNTSGTIAIPRTGVSIPFTVQGNIAEQIILPRVEFNAVGSERVEGKGIVITAADPVRVTAIHYKAYFSDAASILPTERLGSQYVVIAAMDDTQFSPGEFLIVATEDDTEIEIIPSVITLGIRPAGVPFTIVLDRGESYQVQGMEDLSGTMVRSIRGERFALFSGARAAAIDCNDDSHVYDQLYPTHELGLQYITIPFVGKNGDLIKIAATEDSTIVRIDCQRSFRLDRGEHYDTVTSAPLAITGSRPIAVAQFGRGQFCSGPGGPTMLALLPTSLALKRGTFKSLYRYNPLITRPHFDLHYLNIVVRSRFSASIRVDGSPLGASFRPVPGDRDYVYAQVPIGSDTGTHLVTCDSGLIAYAYGFGDFDAYTYSVGTDTIASRGADTLKFRFALSGADLGIAVRGCDTITASGTICAGAPVTFIADVDSTFTEILWTFGDGASATGPTVSHRYNDTGTYRVRISAIDGNCNAYTTIGSLTIGNCISRSAPRVVIAPNPTAGKLTITYTIPERSEVRVELFDAFGRVVATIADGLHEEGRHGGAYDIGEYPAGNYLLRFSFEGGQVVERIVKVD